MTARRPIGGQGVLAQSPPCPLLVALESNMTPSRTVTPNYIAGGLGLSFTSVIFWIISDQDSN
jgi:hypothetical protein